MTNWKNKQISFVVKENESKTVLFESLEDLDEISYLGASCGCTKPKLVGKKSIKVDFKPERVPIHLRGKGFYTTIKTITILYYTGEKEELTIKAQVNKVN